MNLYTAFVIQNLDNDIRCKSYGKLEDTDKWAGAINLYHGGFFHTTLISSNHVFSSPEVAVLAMESIVDQVRALDFGRDLKKMKNDPFPERRV